ncbi:hypothetical protein AAG906_037728 [Vitis piasezkii]
MKKRKRKKKQKVTEPVHLASVEEPLVSCVQLMELLNRFFPIGTNKPEILYKMKRVKRKRTKVEARMSSKEQLANWQIVQGGLPPAHAWKVQKLFVIFIVK